MFQKIPTQKVAANDFLRMKTYCILYDVEYSHGVISSSRCIDLSFGRCVRKQVGAICTELLFSLYF